MASNNGGFWDTSAGRWVSSSKNILGSVLGAAALAAQVAIGLGPWWPAVIVASYCVGALVAPRDRVEMKGMGGGDRAGSTADELSAQLTALRRLTRGEAKRLPADAWALVQKTLDALDSIVERWGDLASAPDQSHAVEQMTLDYLPTSLQTYLNLPRTFALKERVEGRRSAHEELLEQLTLLQRESERIRNAVFAKDLDRLGDQSRFLRDKFGRSELDL